MPSVYMHGKDSTSVYILGVDVVEAHGNKRFHEGLHQLQNNRHAVPSLSPFDLLAFLSPNLYISMYQKSLHPPHYFFCHLCVCLCLFMHVWN